MIEVRVTAEFDNWFNRLRDSQARTEIGSRLVRIELGLPLREAGDVFRERTIAMTETGEEAVVGKTARVVKEVVLRKQVGERTETVTDTVRRTEVEVGSSSETRQTDADRY